MNEAPTIEEVVEIAFSMTPSGMSGDAANLEFDGCHCHACNEPVGGHLRVNEDSGHDYAVWTDVFMDEHWNLYCEECLRWTEDDVDDESHDLGRCTCGTCDEDRAEAGYVARRFA